MELRHLRYFLAVAEEGSMSGAARRVFIAQPALSRQIRDLERHVGLPLFVRTGRGVELTAAGARLLPDARQAVQAFDLALLSARADTQFEAPSTGAMPHLRVGLFPGRHATSELTAPMLRLFAAKHPGVSLNLVDLDLHDFGSALSSGRVDVALTRTPLDDDEGIDATPLFDEPRAVLLPVAHPLAEAKDLAPADLEPLQAATWLQRGPLPASFWEYYTLGDLWDTRDLLREAPLPKQGRHMVDAVARDGTVIIAAASAVRRWRPDVVTAPHLSGLRGSTAVVAARKDDDRSLVLAFKATARTTAESFVHLVQDAVLVRV